MANACSGEWVTVTYRRRPHQVQFLDRSRDGAPAHVGQKDRASSTPAFRGRRWTQSLCPNSPIPKPNPGSHFRHAQVMLERLQPPEDLLVEEVVLAFGNSRTNKLKETTQKYVQGTVRGVKKVFPLAEIGKLPVEERENLESLSAYLERNHPYIPPLPADKFHTEEDDVHWTSEMAAAIFEHWMGYLNFLTL